MEDVISPIATALELIGVLVIVVGLVIASIALLWGTFVRWGARSTLSAVSDIRRWDTLEESVAPYRVNLLRVIVLGLTFLVAGDVVETASVQRTIGDVGVLAAIVVVRELLSVALHMETTGRWPWQGREAAENAAPEPGPESPETAPALTKTSQPWYRGGFLGIAIVALFAIGLLKAAGV